MTKEDLLLALQTLNPEISIAKWIEENPDFIIFGKRKELKHLPDGFEWDGEVLTNKKSVETQDIIEVTVVEINKVR